MRVGAYTVIDNGETSVKLFNTIENAERAMEAAGAELGDAQDGVCELDLPLIEDQLAINTETGEITTVTPVTA
jgi:hypothetical protein